MIKILVRHFPLLSLLLKNCLFKMKFSLQTILFCKAKRKYNIKTMFNLKKAMDLFKMMLIKFKMIIKAIILELNFFILKEISMKMIFFKKKIQNLISLNSQHS